jgi:hypothetical protein
VGDFELAWAPRAESEIAGPTVPFLGRETLITNKRATGRLEDLADIEALGRTARLETDAFAAHHGTGGRPSFGPVFSVAPGCASLTTRC